MYKFNIKNLYTANFGTINAHLSDYCIAKNEKDIIVRVLSKLPHKILYRSSAQQHERKIQETLKKIQKMENRKNGTIKDKSG